MHATTKNLVLGIILAMVLGVTGGMANDECDLVSFAVENQQFDPAGSFVGTTEVTFLEVDPVTGSTTPTGETLTLNCSVTLHAFQLDGNYQTSHSCVGPKGSKVEYVAIHTGQFIPLENDPDGFAFGAIDSGEILTGKGRWNCGADATGLDPLTGNFISRARLWSPEAPGLFVGGGVGRWCNCSGGSE